MESHISSHSLGSKLISTCNIHSSFPFSMPDELYVNPHFEGSNTMYNYSFRDGKILVFSPKKKNYLMYNTNINFMGLKSC